ncbi:hypothetical protein ACFQZ4_03275 [Catellatospora coxensis]
MSKLRVPAVSAAIALALTGCVPGSGGGQADPPGRPPLPAAPRRRRRQRSRSTSPTGTPGSR